MSPRCTAFLTADRAWREDNGKIGLAGIFENILVEKAPSTIQPFFIYFSLRNIAHGKHKMAITMLDDNNAVIFQVDGEVEVAADDSSFQAQLPVPPSMVNKTGVHSLILYFDDIDLVKHQINIHQGEAKPG